MEGGKSHLTVWVTFPDRETARQIATKVVEEQLAACVNLVPGVESVYRWEGKVERAHEILGILKTTEALQETLRDRLVELHPHDVPEVLFVPIAGGSEAYLDWITQSTGGSSQSD